MKHLPNTITALRITGSISLLLFIAVPTINWSIIPIAIVTVAATLAAIQEGCNIRHKIDTV